MLVVSILAVGDPSTPAAMEVELLPFTFTSNFESGNLARVERVDPPGSYVGTSSTTSTSGSNSRKKASCVAQQSQQQSPGPPELPVNYEFNLWTRPDCADSQYENNNRTWFFFGIKGSCTGSRVRLSVMNLNKQSKLYSQGMQPVMKQVPCQGDPSKIRWERIKEKCTYRSAEGSTVCSWVHTVVDGSATTFYAFTYPFTYLESQTMLEALDHKFPANCPTLYYHRELLIYSLDGWRTDLITVSSNAGKTEEREERIPGLFPNHDELRPHCFPGKKVVFVSARVHPGETPASFVFNGFLDFIVSNNPRAVLLRDMFVFKLIPMLNPDGVVRGHYRSDQRGVNLNRVYSDPSPVLHPTIYAARQIILYHHHGQLTTENQDTDTSTALSSSDSKSQANTSTTSTGSGSTPPVVMDEDTCHSFSEATGTVSGSGGNPSSHGNVRGRRSSFYELDEPSASGWDISSSLQGTFQRDHESGHDDCSNASCMSETETGVTSMFGSMASVSDFRNLLSANKVSMQTGLQSNLKTENHNMKSRDLFLKDLQKEHVDKMQLSSRVTEDSDKIDLSNKLHPWEAISTSLNTKTTADPVSTVTSPVNKNIFPMHTSTSNSSQQDLLPDIGATSNVTLQSSGDTSMTSYKFLSAPSLDTTTSNTLSPKGTSTSQMNFLGAGTRDLCGGMASSSESEAETGRPGREALDMAAINSRSSIMAGTNTILRNAKLDTPQTSDVSQTQHNFSSRDLAPPTPVPEETEVNSGLYLYVDLHGHASKRGIFIYGNWYEDAGIMVENMLFPKLMSINHPNFDFAACNFSERNMYLKDRRDGMSKEGSGRVAIMRATGLLRSYTLECNYNTGRTYNNCPPSPMDSSRAKAREANCTSPPKYTPTIFEECGRQLGVSLLDETYDAELGVSGSCDQWSRLPHSQYHNIAGVRSWLHHFLASSSLSPRTHNTGPHGARTPNTRPSGGKLQSSVERLSKSCGNSTRLSAKQGSPNTPGSPRLPRSSRSTLRTRRHSWCPTVDAENQEPRDSPGGTARVRTGGKKSSGGGNSSTKKKSLKKASGSPKKIRVARSLTFTELGESSLISGHGGTGEGKISSSKISSSKHSLTASVSLTPNLNVKLSISDTPESPTLVKKVEKLRRQRSKGLGSSGNKKIKMSPSSSSHNAEDSAIIKAKDPDFYSLPCLEVGDGGRKCSPLSPSQEGFYGSSQSPLSPRSPLSSVCEPQASQTFTTTAPIDILVQPKSPSLVTTGLVNSSVKKVKVLTSPSKRSSKHNLKSLSKSMDRLPAVAGSTGERLKLLPKKVKKKLGAGRSVTDLSTKMAGSIPSIKSTGSQSTLDWTIKPTGSQDWTIKPTGSQPTLDWMISEPQLPRSSDIDSVVPPKVKKRKKISRKSL